MPEDGTTATEPTNEPVVDESAVETVNDEVAPESDDDSDIVVPEGAENPDAVRNAIKAERKAARDANARARAFEQRLREREEHETPLEDLVKSANEKAEAAALRALRYEVAAETGLPLSLAARLQGSDRDTLAADAASLKELVGTNAPAPALPPEGGTRQTPPAPSADPVVAHNQLLGNLLGAAQERRAGGVNPLSVLEPAPED